MRAIGSRRICGPRLQTIALVAPELGEAELARLTARVDPAVTHLTVYGAANARALLANRDVYQASPIGLAAMPPASLAGVEWVEIGVGDPSADWTTLGTLALFADIASVAQGGPAAASRCGVAHVSATRDGDSYVLNPQGCQQTAVK